MVRLTGPTSVAAVHGRLRRSTSAGRARLTCHVLRHERLGTPSLRTVHRGADGLVTTLGGSGSRRHHCGDPVRIVLGGSVPSIRRAGEQPDCTTGCDLGIIPEFPSGCGSSDDPAAPYGPAR